MARRKKRSKAEPAAADSSAAKTLAGPPVTGLGPLLQRAGLSKRPAGERSPSTSPSPGAAAPGRVSPPPQPPRPAEPPAAARPDAPPPSAPRFVPRSAGDLAAWNRAYAGVRALPDPRRASRVGRAATSAASPPDPGEATARARIGALVAGGVRFTIERDLEAGFVRGLREGADPRLWRRLGGRGFCPEATLDLHGMHQLQAAHCVHDFVRAKQRSGLRWLLIVVGKGQHSEGGVPVLREVTVQALCKGGAAPLVQAFSSADPRHGGHGAIAVLLR